MSAPPSPVSPDEPAAEVPPWRLATPAFVDVLAAAIARSTAEPEQAPGPTLQAKGLSPGTPSVLPQYAPQQEPQQGLPPQPGFAPEHLPQFRPTPSPQVHLPQDRGPSI